MVPRAVEVVAGPGGPVVAVAVEVVPEEADGLLVDDDLRPGDEERALGGESASPAPSTKPRASALKTGTRTLTRSRSRSSSSESLTARAGEVAEVVEGEAGHHRVEVHDAEPLAGPRVEEDVRDLGVVVGGAHGDLAARGGAGEGRGERAPRSRSALISFATAGGARDPVRRDSPLERDEPTPACRGRPRSSRGAAGPGGPESWARKRPNARAVSRASPLAGRALDRARALDPREQPPGLARRVHVVRDARRASARSERTRRSVSAAPSRARWSATCSVTRAMFSMTSSGWWKTWRLICWRR